MGSLLRYFSIFILAILVSTPLYAKSAYSPRHTGTEPPGGPRGQDVLPGRTISRTPDGGMGYVDAYGNTLTDKIPEERKPRHRPRPGAYGGPPRIPDNSLPEAASSGPPKWNFR